MTKALLPLYAAFPISGAVTTLLGPLLPVLLRKWNLTDAQGGQMFLVQFIASTIGAVASGAVGRRWKPAHILAACYACIACAVAGIGAASHPWALGLITLYGLALGVSIPLTNLLAATEACGGETTALNILNLAWCTGAVVTPPLVALGISRLGLLPTLSACAVLALLASLVSLSGSATLAAHPSASARLSRTSRTIAWTAIFLFLYVGVENCASGWFPTYAQRSTGAGLESATATQSVLWGAIMVTRAVAARWLREAWGTVILRAGTLLAFGGVIVVISANTMTVVYLGAAMTGVGLAPLFATAVALFTRQTGPDAAAWIGIVFAFGGCGGAALPFIVGAISTSAQSLATGILVVAIALLLMLGVTVPLSSRQSARGHQSTG